MADNIIETLHGDTIVRVKIVFGTGSVEFERDPFARGGIREVASGRHGSLRLAQLKAARDIALLRIFPVTRRTPVPAQLVRQLSLF